MLAHAAATLKRGKLAADLGVLAELARKHEIKALAIGLPLNMDGSEGPRCQSVRQFAANIANHGPPALAALPVVWQDERLSTRRRHARHDRRLRHEPRQARRKSQRGGRGMDSGERAGEGCADLLLRRLDRGPQGRAERPSPR